MNLQRLTGSIDIGGTKTAVGIVTKNGALLTYAEFPTQPNRANGGEDLVPSLL
ncbi:hypothetical protein EV207_1346 [Scopulibacillus darangshiensis]|uniref:ROK family protein n=1 Tax=Scopulibacillus darangshiensis TaxID=442528 RepID=A0A4R2NN27_9BACL|nr:hypothetical protein [Scopulibacillus darangshiensis]TCP22664.1 hypothetical protein EV207_1346 [Scopulibacillus darangshiensis]